MKKILFVDRDHTDRAFALEFLTKKYMAEYARRTQLHLPWEITSAGLRAYAGQQMNPELRSGLASLGHHINGYTAVEATTPLLQGISLILCPSKPIYRRFQNSGIETKLVSDFAFGTNREIRSPDYYIISREASFFERVVKKMQGKIDETNFHDLHNFYIAYAKELAEYARGITNRLIDSEGFKEKL
jgi:protein-tyrosine-phosphatase